jgi:ATP-dependent DNA helicase DinG
MFEVLASSEGEIPRNPFGDLGVETNHILTEVDKAAYDNAVSLGWSSDPGFDIDSIEDEDDRSQLLAIYALRKTIERTNETLARSITPDENTVLYVTTTERGFKKLTLAPISVGKLVGPKLQMIPSVVITSATMAVGGKFEDIKYQLGLTRSYYRDDAGAAHIPKQIHELVLSTPFNYDKQALLYTPRHIPLPVGASDPRRSAYISVVVNECTRLIRASDGNAFILFTSKQDLLDVYAGLQEEDLPNPLIIQDDDASNTLRTYMMTPKSVLLGVKSFWEGVDVQGSKLQLVIITKLPFPPVTDPVLQARSRQLIAEQVACGIPAETAKSSVFSRLQIPYMLTELRQGAGRLIRARTDKGVLAILDSRIFTGNSKDMPLPNQQSYKGYGKLVAEATGFNNHVFEFEIVRRVFEQWNTRNAAA